MKKNFVLITLLLSLALHLAARPATRQKLTLISIELFTD